MAVDEDVERLKESSRELVMAAASVAFAEERKRTDEELAAVLRDSLMMSDQVADAKVKVTQETEDERTVREVMEAPERFKVDLQLVLKGALPTIETSVMVDEERTKPNETPDVFDDGSRPELDRSPDDTHDKIGLPSSGQ